MHSQTYSCPLNIPNLIRELKISDLHSPKLTVPKIFPYIELYHNTRPKPIHLQDLSRNNGLLSTLQKKLKKQKNTHFHSSTYRYRSFHINQKDFIQGVRSELEHNDYNLIKEKSRSVSNKKVYDKNTSFRDFSNLGVVPHCKKLVLPHRKSSLPDYGKNFSSLELNNMQNFLFDEKIECQDASCNT